MLSRSTFSGPDKGKTVSGGRIFLIVFLLLIQTGIILYAVSMAVRTRVRVIWLDPYLQLDILCYGVQSSAGLIYEHFPGLGDAVDVTVISVAVIGEGFHPGIGDISPAKSEY